jgi:hypothetical protein
VYVGNILALLRLHPAILERIEKLEPGGTGAEVTEGWLRPIARLTPAEQLVAVAERLDLTAASKWDEKNLIRPLVVGAALGEQDQVCDDRANRSLLRDGRDP